MRLQLFGLASTGLSVAVVLHAFVKQRGMFFPMCVQLTQSSTNVMILLANFVYFTVMFGRLLQYWIFGHLRALEIEHLYERSWFSVMDTCLALTIFKDDFNVFFMLNLVALVFCKVFHWIIQDRIDFMEQSTGLTRSFHIKINFAILSFLVFDVSFFAYAVMQTLDVGPSLLIYFGFEYAMLSLSLMVSFVKYTLHLTDLQREHPWEDKSMYLFYVDLFNDFMKLAGYLVFFGLVMHYYGLPLHIVRDVYVTGRQFYQRLMDLIRYREATANMEQRYPVATEQELEQTDRICIVCREEMHLGEQRGLMPKKLPCGHMFHMRCLRSWLERQQACPTCRQSVLEQRPRPQENPLQQLMNRYQPPRHPPQPAPQPQATLVPLGTVEQLFPQRAFDHLTDEQLVQLQGNARENIIQRLDQIQNIQQQLTGITTQLTQILQLLPEQQNQ
ncbi:hypothetical protein EDD86DRAFT_60024 [Gorgonomyces haynaldii]|nr:hypothetical protein EDD86DRAFT_60024 [Gorgonomyces haynaldii]